MPCFFFVDTRVSNRCAGRPKANPRGHTAGKQIRHAADQGAQKAADTEVSAQATPRCLVRGHLTRLGHPDTTPTSAADLEVMEYPQPLGFKFPHPHRSGDPLGKPPKGPRGGAYRGPARNTRWLDGQGEFNSIPSQFVRTIAVEGLDLFLRPGPLRERIEGVFNRPRCRWVAIQPIGSPIVEHQRRVRTLVASVVFRLKAALANEVVSCALSSEFRRHFAHVDHTLLAIV